VVSNVRKIGKVNGIYYAPSKLEFYRCRRLCEAPSLLFYFLILLIYSGDRFLLGFAGVGNSKPVKFGMNL
jgi:hypothetical protein